jgi:cell wall-associated NlpC family hydrolase
MKKILIITMLFSLSACSTAKHINNKPSVNQTVAMNKTPSNVQEKISNPQDLNISDENIQNVILYALSLLDINYKWGGNNPEYGLDCSGLINYVFKNGAGIKLPRTSKELATKGKKVETPDMGDLVFFSDRSDKTPTHVGLYIGENRFVHAPRTGDYIKVSKLNNVYYKKHYLYAVRLIT